MDNSLNGKELSLTENNPKTDPFDWSNLLSLRKVSYLDQDTQRGIIL